MGMNCPFLFLLEEHSRRLTTEEREILADIQKIYNRLPPSHRFATVHGAGHFSFSDISVTFNPLVTRVSGAAGSLSGRRSLEITADTVRTFFDVHLKGADPSSLDRLPTHYPELEFGFQ
jgi:hypothetical protein